jgi:hypothetical protein
MEQNSLPTGKNTDESSFVSEHPLSTPTTFEPIADVNFPVDTYTAKVIGGGGSSSSIGGLSYNPTYTQIKSTGPTALVFQNNLFAVGVTWAGGKFTISTAGVYTVGCVMTCQSSTNSLEQESFYSYVYQNGSVAIQGTGIGTVPAATNSVSAVGCVNCKVGDTISFYAGAISGVSGVNYFNISTTQSQTYGFIHG